MSDDRIMPETSRIPHAAAEAEIARFFSRAADVGPPTLPSVGQLRWRAQILARMAAAEERAASARRPALAGVVVAAVAAAIGLTLSLSGIDLGVGSALAALSESPWSAFVLLLAGLGLIAGLTALARPRAVKR